MNEQFTATVTGGSTTTTKKTGKKYTYEYRMVHIPHRLYDLVQRGDKISL